MWKAFAPLQRPSIVFDLSKQPTAEATLKLREKYPDRVPIFVDRIDGSPNVPPIDKNRFLVPFDFTVGQLMHMIRKRVQLKPEEAIFMYIVSSSTAPSGVLPPTHALVKDMYFQHKEKNEVLYIRYSKESVFG